MKQQETGSSKTKGTILVVEDDEGIRDELAALLADEGYAVATSADGLEALEHLNSEAPPGLVVLDLMLPNLDGWRLRQLMLLDPDLAGVPCLVITAAGKAAYGIRADYVFFKPLDTERFLGVVGRCMRTDDPEPDEPTPTPGGGSRRQQPRTR